ncbi:MAG: hypothetical protein NTV24_03890 [Candidatus Woesebacteria bacterium]|nr:hypothetical protein [Candidatus Woesebacteria bacterium]
MEHNVWPNSHNLILGNFEGNHKQGLKFEIDHNGKMQSEATTDPTVVARALVCKTKCKLYSDEYAFHFYINGQKEGATKLVNDLYDDVHYVRSVNWVRDIDNFFKNVKAPDFIRLLPNGRSPFYEGTFTERKAALQALSLGLANIVPLSAVKTDVDQVLLDIDAAELDQQDKIDLLKASSTKLEGYRVDCATHSFSDLGFFIEKYPNSPKDIERTFNVAMLRTYSKPTTAGASEYLVGILAGKQAEGGFPISDTMKLLFINLTGNAVKIYTSASADINQAVPAGAYLLDGDAEVELFITQLGAPGNRYLWIVNQSSTEAGQVSIMIVG